MGKVINIAIFAFFVALCAGCKARRINYQEEKNLALQTKFECREVSSRDFASTLMSHLTISDSTLRKTKIRIRIYDTAIDNRQGEECPMSAEIEIDKTESEGTAIIERDTQDIRQVDTTRVTADIEAQIDRMEKSEDRSLPYGNIGIFVITAGLIWLVYKVKK